MAGYTAPPPPRGTQITGGPGFSLHCHSSKSSPLWPLCMTSYLVPGLHSCFFHSLLLSAAGVNFIKSKLIKALSYLTRGPDGLSGFTPFLSFVSAPSHSAPPRHASHCPPPLRWALQRGSPSGSSSLLSFLSVNHPLVSAEPLSQTFPEAPA